MEPLESTCGDIFSYMWKNTTVPVENVFGEVPEGTKRVRIWLQNVSKEVLCGIYGSQKALRELQRLQISKNLRISLVFPLFSTPKQKSASLPPGAIFCPPLPGPLPLSIFSARSNVCKTSSADSESPERFPSYMGARTRLEGSKSSRY